MTTISLTGVQARVSTSSYSNYAAPGYVSSGYADLRSPNNFSRYVTSGYITGYSSYESNYYHTDPGYTVEGYDFKVGIVPTIDYNLTIGLSGVFATGVAGRISAGELFGVETTVSPGSITASQSVTSVITGNTTNVNPGSVLFFVSYSLVGNVATLNPGSVLVSQSVNKALTGNFSSGIVGNIGSLKSYDLTSSTIVISHGNIGTSQSVTKAISGNSATVQLGNISATQAIFTDIGLTGNSATGIISATQDYNHVYAYPTIVDLSYGSMAEFMGVVVLEDEKKQGSELVYG
jgi:hypothetical protein